MTRSATAGVTVGTPPVTEARRPRTGRWSTLPCRQRNPDLWFAESPTQLETAKSLCRDCPLREQCLAGALARREPWGVWGGEIVRRGVVVAVKRGRGRPRKTAHASAA